MNEKSKNLKPEFYNLIAQNAANQQHIHAYRPNAKNVIFGFKGSQNV